MLKRTIWAAFAIFAVWAILDVMLHGVLLRETYETSANLLRPMEAMNKPLIYLVKLVLIACFILIYTLLISKKSLMSGIIFGALFGLASGIAAGFGTYIHTPIPLTLAWAWFLGALVKDIAAGAIVGFLVRQDGESLRINAQNFTES